MTEWAAVTALPWRA